MKATEKNIYGLRYLKSLKEGDRVVETGMSGMWGAIGVVYKSKNKGQTYGSMCVMWDLPEGKMGTSITHGTRRVKDVLRDKSNAVERAWGVIANASEGNWTLQNKQWNEAASRWRDRYVHESFTPEEKCSFCNGKGEITKGRIMKGAACPSCQGRGSALPVLDKIYVVWEVSDEGHLERRVSQHRCDVTARKEAEKLTKQSAVLRYVVHPEEVLP